MFSLPGGQVLAEVGLRSVLTVPITGALGILGAMQLIRGDAQPSFGFADLELMEELAGRIGAAMNTAVLFDRQARTSAAFETLERVSGGIAAAATITEIFRAVTTHGAAGVGAHGASLLLSDEADAVLRVAESTHADDSDVVASHLEVGAEALAGPAIVRRVIHGSDEEPGGRTPMALAMPLSVMNRVLGALVFTFDDEREFTREEMSMFVTLGSRCAGALERARLYERERAIALTLQNRLLSTLPATPPWITVAACYQPATRMEIGGDWYQVLDAGGGRIVAVVGDAVGHGLSAAAAMGQLRASIATAVANDAEPDHALAAVDLFAVRGADTLGASVAYVLLDEGAPARYASAGHLPLLSVTADGRTALLEDGRRPLLGFRERDAVNVTADVAFGPGDTIVMFTDGLIERRGEWIDAGLDRLQRVVESSRLLSPQALCDTIVLELTAGETVADDIALLVLRRNAVE